MLEKRLIKLESMRVLVIDEVNWNFGRQFVFCYLISCFCGIEFEVLTLNGRWDVL